SYDISEYSKEREMDIAIREWLATLPEAERDERESEIRESFTEYLETHQKELTQTSVVRVDVDETSLTVEETGSVPGRPLDQFALDEYEGTLRVTTTIPRVGDAESVNNLYVLDSESLDRESEVTGMGEGQRVYAVRYAGDTAYVVTFRQVDPFYVIDFEEPTDPELLGELKLPGFSSYLHPVDDDHVLGVGEERGKVKTVLFDVSDPGDPEIADSRVLDRGWSAVAESHHAFLMDRKHGVFVLPAGEESVVVDYTGGSLDVEATVETDGRATRARYVDDSLYVFAGDSITVVDQTTWETATVLDLDADA
ncbi:MAG: beta-propeller domain-containing protein, partial [Haloferacaceae archaeon]